MQFVYPGFLWALALISIPILIHLFNFRRYKKVEFSNVAMLKEIETQSRKSRQLKKWLILLSRVLAIAALVLAFAQPFIPLNKKVTGRSLQAVYIDNSFSMNASGEGGPLFEQAKNAARTIVNELERDQEIFMIANQKLSSQNILSKQQAIEWIDELEISADVNNFSQTLVSAQRISKQEGYAQMFTYLISDFQRSSELNVVVDSTTNLNLVRLEPLGVKNISIDSVWLASPLNNTDDPIELKVKLRNHGEQKMDKVNLVLNVNGVQQGAQSISISGKSQNIIDLAFKSSTNGWLSGELKINDPLVSFDNTYYFGLELKKKYSVLVLTDGSSHFTSLFGGDEQFNLEVKKPLDLDYSLMSSYDMIILDQLSINSAALNSQVEAFLSEGGVVFYVPSSNSSTNATGLPLASQGTVKTVDLSIRSEDLSHPFFKGVFSRIPRNNVLPKVSKLYSISPTSQNEVLLSLKDKTAVFVRTRVGSGLLYQLAFPLDLDWSTFHEHELFVLSTLKAAFSKSNQNEISYSLNYAGSIPLPTTAREKALIAATKDQEVILESAAVEGKFRYWLNEELSTAGIYVLKYQDQQDTLGLLALNYNRLESAQDYYEKDELIEAFGAQLKFYNNEPEMLQSLASNTTSSKPLWKLFMVFCLIFLLIEILLLRFLKS